MQKGTPVERELGEEYCRHKGGWALGRKVKEYWWGRNIQGKSDGHKFARETWTDLRAEGRENCLIMYRVLEKTPSGNTLSHSIQCSSEAELSNISILEHGLGRSILPGDAAKGEEVLILIDLACDTFETLLGKRGAGNSTETKPSHLKATHCSL